MKLLLLLLVSFVYSNSLVDSAQPYFPEQVVFTRDNNHTIIAIDEVNQRAYLKYNITSEDTDVAYVMRRLPYAKPNTPQTNHYAQLILSQSRSFSCSYLTYWEYTANGIGLFPFHWGNDSSYRIKNYFDFKYPMIHTTNESTNEDYWYSNKTCRTDSGEVYRCQEVYFKKNTNIPLRYSEVVEDDTEIVRRTENYTIYSTEKPSDSFFDTIPKDWSDVCSDGDLGVSYDHDEVVVDFKHNAKVKVWLSAPPHKIHGDDTVIISWRSFLCTNCFSWTPLEFVFNGTNFQEGQTLTITRIKDSDQTVLIPNCSGGGFDNVACYAMYLTMD